MVWLRTIYACTLTAALVACSPMQQSVQGTSAPAGTSARSNDCSFNAAQHHKGLREHDCLRWRMERERRLIEHAEIVNNFRLADPKKAWRWVPQGLSLLSHDPRKAAAHFASCEKALGPQAWCSYGRAAAALAVGTPLAALQYIQVARSKKPKQPRIAALEMRIRLELNEVERADTLLARFLLSHPYNQSIWLAAARLRLHHRDVRKARKHIADLVSHQTHNPAPRQLLAELHLLVGNSAAATRFLHEAVALNPRAVTARLLLARTLSQNGQHSDALNHWSNLCDHHQGPFCLELGRAHLRAGAPERALGWADNALKESPRSLDAMSLKARALIAIGRIQEALAMRPVLYADPVTALTERLHIAGALARAELTGKTEAEYTAAIQRYPTQAQAWANYGLWYFMTGRIDRAETVLRQGLERLPKSSILHSGLGQVFEKQGRAKLAMVAFHRAVELDPERTEISDHLAFLEFTNGLQRQAISRWKTVLERGFASDQILQRLALAYRLTGQFELALPLAQELVARRPTEEDLRADLAEIYLRSKRSEDAVQTLKSIRTSGTHTKRALALLATALSASGRLIEAEKTFEAALQEDPANRPLRLTYASFRERMGDEDGAAQIYRAQLARDPDDTVALAGLRRNVGPEKAGNMVAESRYPAARLDAELSRLVQRIPELRPNDVGTVLRDERYVEIDAKGVKSIRHVRSILVRRPSGVARYKEMSVGFHTEFPPKIHRARTLTPDGKIQHVGKDRQRIKDPHAGTPLFGDSRHLVFSFSGVEPGSIVDYEVTTYRPHPELVTAWWDSYILGNADPTVSVTYQLTLPEGSHIQATTPALDPPHSAHRDGKEILVWKRYDLPAYRSHPRSGQSIPAVHVSSMSDWRSVDGWYDELFAPQTRISDSIRREARRISKRYATRSGRIGAVLQYVENNVKYLGIEFGIGAYQPRPASSTLAQGKGDCKDMTALMIALLRVMNIPAYPVLAKPSDQGQIMANHPSPGQFSHVLMYVPNPNGDLWLDATAAMSTLTAIPETLRGQHAFIVDGEGGRLARIPIAKAEEHRLVEHRTYDLTMTGGGTIQSAISLTGDPAGRSRQKLLSISADARKAFLSAPGFLLGNGLIPNKLEVTQLNQPNQNLGINTRTQHPDLVAVQLDGALVFDPDLDIFTNGLLAAPGTGAQLETPRTIERTMVIRPPEGYKFDWSPIQQHIGGPIRLDVSEAREKNQTTIKTRLTFALRSTTQTELARLQASLTKIRKMMTRRLVIKPSKNFKPLNFLRALSAERPEDPQILYHLARQLLVEGLEQEGTFTLEQARRHGDKNPQVLALLTAIYMRNRNIDGAKDALRDLLTTSEAHPRLYLTLSSIVRSESNHDEAHSILAAGRKRFPGHIDLETEWITSLIHRESARDALQAAIELAKRHPKHVEAQRLWSECALRTRDLASARKALRRLLMLKPNDVQALNNLAWALRAVPGGLVESITLAERAVSLAPHVGMTWETLAELYYLGKRYREAAEALERAVSLSPESRLGLQGRLNVMRKRLAEDERGNSRSSDSEN